MFAHSTVNHLNSSAWESSGSVRARPPRSRRLSHLTRARENTSWPQVAVRLLDARFHRAAVFYEALARVKWNVQLGKSTGRTPMTLTSMGASLVHGLIGARARLTSDARDFSRFFCSALCHMSPQQETAREDYAITWQRKRYAGNGCGQRARARTEAIF